VKNGAIPPCWNIVEQTRFFYDPFIKVMNQNIEGSTTEFSSPQNNFPVNMLWQSAEGM